MLAPDFVDRLVPHCEPAPFGVGRSTRLDPKVRSVLRARSRDALSVEGLDVRPLLGSIEETLSPTERLRASLYDVNVYAPGGASDRTRTRPATRTRSAR